MMDDQSLQAMLKEVVHYNPVTGQFVWRQANKKYLKSTHAIAVWDAQKSDKVAGSIRRRSGKQYTEIRLHGKAYLAHRLAWLYENGGFPEGEIDHIDGNGENNSIKNLRVVTRQENQKNQRLSSLNTSGHTGVGWVRRHEKWAATIRANGKSVWLGLFKEKSEATKARKEAERKYGYHANHGSVRPL